MEGRCYCCGKQGNKSPECRHKANIPRDKRAINKDQSHAQTRDDNSSLGPSTTNSVSVHQTQTTESELESDDMHLNWAGIHCSFV